MDIPQDAEPQLDDPQLEEQLQSQQHNDSSSSDVFVDVVHTEESEESVPPALPTCSVVEPFFGPDTGTLRDKFVQIILLDETDAEFYKGESCFIYLLAHYSGIYF